MKYQESELYEMMIETKFVYDIMSPAKDMTVPSGTTNPVSGNSRGLVYVSRFCISSGSGAWKFKGSPVIGWTKESDAE